MATNFPDTSSINQNTGVIWADGDEFDDTANSGLIYYWYDPVWKTKASDVTAGDLTVSSLNSGPLAGFRNYIINGDFRVWQRGDQREVADLSRSVTADMWRSYGLTNGARVTVTKSTDVPAGQGFSYSAQFEENIDGTPATEGSNFVAHIELTNPEESMAPFIPGGTYTLSYWAKGTTTAAIECWSVRFGTSLNAGSVNCTVTEITGPTGSGDWEKLEYRVTMPSAADYTTGSYRALRVYVGNLGDIAADPAYFTGVQLEPGAVATPFEHRPISIELELCKRYFQRVRTQGVIGNYNSSSSNAMFIVPGSEMRTNPSTQPNIQISTGRYQSSGGTSVAISDISAVDASGIRIRIARADGTNVFAPMTLCTASLDLSAEL